MARSKKTVRRGLTLLPLAALLVGAACSGEEKAPVGAKTFTAMPFEYAEGVDPLPFEAMVQREGAKGRAILMPMRVIPAQLDEGDALGNGELADFWTFSLDAPSSVVITVASSEFHPRVTVINNANLTEEGVVQDAMGRDTAMVAETMAAGDYSAVVSPVPATLAEYMDYDEGGSRTPEGAYTVHMVPLGGWIATEGGLMTGTLTEGPTLSDDTYFQDWDFRAKETARYTISLRSSEFDTYLLVLVDGRIVTSNDDANNETNSEVTLEAQAGTRYVIRANSFAAGATGAYRIEISDPMR